MIQITYTSTKESVLNVRRLPAGVYILLIKTRVGDQTRHYFIKN
ncbi:hypothetical protein [Hymenobacter radiodurans]